MAGGAAEMLPVSLNCPLPLRRTHPPTLVCCFCVFAAMGVTSTKSGRLEVNLSLETICIVIEGKNCFLVVVRQRLLG